MIACGVRSSCEAFAANRRSSSIVLLHPVEHRVEGVGEVGEFIAWARQFDAMREVAVAGAARGIRDPIQRTQHDPGEQPPADQPEQDEQHHRPPRVPDEHLEQVGAVRREPAALDAEVALGTNRSSRKPTTNSAIPATTRKPA